MPTDTFLNLPAEKRERFIEAAIDEFADHDYRSASISRLVKKLGIAKGSFYQYFADKQALFLYLVDLGLQEKQALLAQIDMPVGAGWFDRLRWLFRLQARFDLAHPRLAEVGYRALHGDFPFRATLLERLRAQAEAGYREMILAGIEEGALRPDLDVDTAAFVLSTVIGSDLSRHLQNRLGLPAKKMFTRELGDAEWAQANDIFEELIRFLEIGLGRQS